MYRKSMTFLENKELSYLENRTGGLEKYVETRLWKDPDITLNNLDAFLKIAGCRGGYPVQKGEHSVSTIEGKWMERGLLEKRKFKLL